MQLTHIALANLTISPANMRHAKRDPDITDILPSVRKRGVLVPLLVRPNGSAETFEVVAGRRRYFAAKTVADERGESEPLPCGILDDGDDASALEASLIENLHRLDPDEMSQYETFVRLIKDGKTVDAIAATFGLTERQVTQRLALGNLLPKIRDAYRQDKIDVDTLRHLTLASKSQQKDWLKVFESDENEAPYGSQLKQWLFGEQSIATAAALFPLKDYQGHVIADLFGEDSYFADTDLFWDKQNAAIAARKDQYLAAGWSDVVILETGAPFHTWEHEKCPKRKGGKVFVAVSHRGDVAFHEGYMTRKEARRTQAAKEGRAETTTARPEMTSALQTYLALHRHAAVRAKLLDHEGVALRLAVAHMLGGSGLWSVKPDPQRSGRTATDESIAASASQATFVVRRADALTMLGLPENDRLVATQSASTAEIFQRLLAMSDAEVMRVLTTAMSDSLESGSDLVDAVGVHLSVDLRPVWTADGTFFDLVRDKGALTGMVEEVAGKTVADANLTGTGKVLKRIIADCLAGTNGRAKVAGWVPKWLEFPAGSYRPNA